MSTSWPRIVSSGALWTVTYNFIWGIAWFAFMQREWLEALTARRKQPPWTAEVWFFWVVLTFPIGIAVIAYASNRPKSPWRTATVASMGLWLLMTLGMAGWAWEESLSARVVALDSAVNLLAMVIGSVAGSWSLREVHGSKIVC